MTDTINATTAPSAPSADNAVANATIDWPGATTFDDRLRVAALATSKTTVSLDQMVRTATATQSGALGAPARTVTLGAMATPATASASLGVLSLAAGQARVSSVTTFALAQRGKPYVFATTGPDTYDCSGLVTASYRKIGIDLPAYSFTQATYGREVDPSAETIKPGDLIFVRGGRPPRDLGHVGIAISATEWIQAPRTGDVVKVGPLPYDRIQRVRRIVES
jgi:peptidoglycan DL-endopeptidase CwlO